MLNDFFTAILTLVGIVILFVILTAISCGLTFLGLFVLSCIFKLPPAFFFLALFLTLFLFTAQYLYRKARKSPPLYSMVYPRDYYRELSWPWRKYF